MYVCVSSLAFDSGILLRVCCLAWMRLFQTSEATNNQVFTSKKTTGMQKCKRSGVSAGGRVWFRATGCHAEA